MTGTQRDTIVVIGAGVLGLSSALELLGDFPQNDIVLLAAHFAADGLNPSYATTAAGAHYRPIPATTPQLKYEARLAHATWERFKAMATLNPEFGVQFLEGIDFVSGEAASAYTALLPDYVNIDGFRVLRADEMPPGVEFGARYNTYTIDPEVYMAHLLRRFRFRGGQVRRMMLNSAEEAFELDGVSVAMVVNCSGVGFADPNSFVIRGQTCLVANPCDRTVTQQHADGTWSFVIPRPLEGSTIVGGTKQPNDWNPRPSVAVRDELLKKAAEMYPAILNEEGKFKVIQDIVGWRPARQGGLRLEVETLPGDRKVIHAYGAAGRGFELSWGIAEEVSRMARASLPGPVSNQP